MHDYRQLALMLTPIEEKDMILYDMSAEDKTHAVRQFNRALLNAQKDGTDVAQIILKPLITKYPTWGDLALIYGLCLAREGHYKRAMSALEYAVNNTLASEQHLSVAQEAMKFVKLDEAEPEAPKESSSKRKGNSSVIGDGASAGTSRKSVQAPILMKASTGRNDFKMASEKERRDIMMRSGSGSDEMAGDDINVENVRTPAENLRLTVKIVTGVIIAVIVFLLIYLVIIPTAAKVRNSSDTEARLDFILAKLDENKSDPEVASIIEAYAGEFDGEQATSAITQESEEQ